MKHLLPLLLLLLSAYGAAAQTSATAPADSLPGRTRIVRQMSASMCQQLSAADAPNLDKLPEPEVMGYMQKLVTKALLKDSTSLMTMIRVAQQRGQDVQQVSRSLGYDAVQRLASDCPAALPLLARLGLNKQAQAMAATNMPALDPADRAALLPLATSLCTKLTATYTEKAFAGLTPTQRKTQFAALFRQQLAANRPALLKRYTAAQLADVQQLSTISEKVARLMLERPACGAFIMQIGVDEVNRQRGTQTKP